MGIVRHSTPPHMDASTLVTFLLKCPAGIRSVELFGSWDNFAKPCRMQREPLKGRGAWSGIHRFERIVFDGDRPDWHKPRNGALKQGGRYWYFYRLDDEEEYTDPTRPRDTGCPLLPGQILNLLDVPSEVVQPHIRSRSASADFATFDPSVMTLNPKDRFKKVHPKSLSPLNRQYASSEELRRDHHANDQSIDKGTAVFPTAVFPERHVSPLQANPPTSDKPLPRPSTTAQSRTISQSAWFPFKIGPSVEQLRKLSDLVPFHPSAEANSDDRPSTRHGGSPISSASFQSFSSVSTRYLNQTNEASVYATSPISMPSARPSRAAEQATPLGLGISLDNSEYETAGEGPSSVVDTTAPTVPVTCDDDDEDEDVDHTITAPLATYASLGPDDPGFDLWSPTFSADTVSSGGLNTPFRLSVQFPHESNSHSTVDKSLDDISRRLDRLRTAEDDDGAKNTHSQTHDDDGRFDTMRPTQNQLNNFTIKRKPLPQQRPRVMGEDFFTSPSLPQRDDSTHDAGEPSLSDAIFGELSFLRQAIH